MTVIVSKEVFLLQFVQLAAHFQQLSSQQMTERVQAVVSGIGHQIFATFLLEQRDQLTQVRPIFAQIRQLMGQENFQIDEQVCQLTMHALHKLNQISASYKALWRQETEILNPLKQWIKADAEAFAERTEAAERLLDFFSSETASHLNFSDLKITSLPPLLFHPKVAARLKDLDLSAGAFEQLPCEIARLTNLTSLKLNDCQQLKTLPSTFGALAQLERLEMRRDLAGQEPLEIHWPPSMTMLAELRHVSLAGYRMKEIPDWILQNRYLQHVEINHSGLTKLPLHWVCPNLFHLDLSCNVIAQLPEQFPLALNQLEILNLSGNPIACIPSSWLEAPATLLISLIDIGMPIQALQTLEGEVMQTEYAGPTILLTEQSTNELGLRFFLMDIFKDIFEEAQRPLPKSEHIQLVRAFKTIAEELKVGQSSEHTLGLVERWLLKCMQLAPKDDQKEAFFKLLVDIVRTIEGQAPLQAFFKVLVPESLSSCGDRFLLGLIKLEVEAIKPKAQDLSPKQLYDRLRKGSYALTLLERLCRSWILEKSLAMQKTLRSSGALEVEIVDIIEETIDPVEYYLALPLQIGQRLNLGFFQHQMLYPKLVTISSQDLEQCTAVIQEQLEDTEAVLTFLATDPIWIECLAIHMKEKLEAIDKAVEFIVSFEEAEAYRVTSVKKISMDLLESFEEDVKN
jgi:hypothetical protein